MVAKRSPKTAGQKKRPAKTAKRKARQAKTTAARDSGPKSKAKKTSAKRKATAKAKTAKPSAKKAAETTARRPGGAARVAKASKKKRTKARGAKPGRSLDLEGFRLQLRQKQTELLQAYHSAKGDTRQRQNDGTEDYIDYAVSSYDREFLLSLTELEQTQLMLVEEALKRLDHGDFGRCSHCDKPIPSKRLEVHPWARYCVRCQELADQGLTDESVDDLPEEEDVEVDSEDDDEGEEEDYESEIEATGSSGRHRLMNG